jgi:hypothetical protein
MVARHRWQLAIAGALVLLAACGSGGGKPAASTSPRQGAAAPVGAAVTATIPATEAPTLSAAAATPATNPATRVNGTVASASGDQVLLQDGSRFQLGATTAITKTVTVTPAAIQVGALVAVTAMRQPDNTLLASQVRLTSPSTTFRQGQSPLNGGNLMTNATVAQVNGSSFMVTFPGGGAQVKLAPDAQVTQVVPGAASDLKAGTMVSAAVSDGVAESVSLR